ncbi:hypothetical protein F2Q69_00013841 [Brassica cretica]|uniref:Uncharacterized protein n=1 Tax=Brassica cretica TaxID=69181 RepID=A0A8S9QU26_BRACR|nr:hypothetical protein F2Q69_00013841 [Brassica cretica]
MSQLGRVVTPCLSGTCMDVQDLSLKLIQVAPKGLLGSELLRLSPVLSVTDEAFLSKYVMKHDDKGLVSELMAIFTGDLVPHRSPKI